MLKNIGLYIIIVTSIPVLEEVQAWKRTACLGMLTATTIIRYKNRYIPNDMESFCKSKRWFTISNTWSTRCDFRGLEPSVCKNLPKNQQSSFILWRARFKIQRLNLIRFMAESFRNTITVLSTLGRVYYLSPTT